MRKTFYVSLLLMAFIAISGCKKDNETGNPEIITCPITNITDSSAESGGNIIEDGGRTVISRGVCWSESENPTVSDNKTDDGQGEGIFTSTIGGLRSFRTYFVRAYLVNNADTIYGDEYSFKTKGINVTDIDGNVYGSIEIGTQIWMAENLKTTKYQNGDLIGTTTIDLTDEIDPRYQWAHYNDESYVPTYGRLYTWFVASDTRNVCPAGWHVPTDQEWETLKFYLGGESIAGGKLKETDTVHWNSPNTGATNETEFTARPGGYRRITGQFVSEGISCYFWSSTPEPYGHDNWAMGPGMYYNKSILLRGGHDKKSGMSIRCLKDY